MERKSDLNNLKQQYFQGEKRQRRNILAKTAKKLDQEKNKQFFQLIMDELEKKSSAELWAEFILLCPNGFKRYTQRYQQIPETEILKEIFREKDDFEKGIQQTCPKTILKQIIRFLCKYGVEEKYVLPKVFPILEGSLKRELINELKKEVTLETVAFKKKLLLLNMQIFLKEDDYKETLKWLMSKAKTDKDVSEIYRSIEGIDRYELNQDSMLSYFFMDASDFFEKLKENIKVEDTAEAFYEESYIDCYDEFSDEVDNFISPETEDKISFVEYWIEHLQD